jgi:hypothetical protein
MVAISGTQNTHLRYITLGKPLIETLTRWLIYNRNFFRVDSNLSAEEPTCGAILAYAAGGDNSPKSAMLLVPVVPVAREAVGG